MNKEQYLDEAIRKIKKAIGKEYDKGDYKVKGLLTTERPVTPIIEIIFPNKLVYTYDLRLAYNLHDRYDISFKESFKPIKKVVMADVECYNNKQNEVETITPDNPEEFEEEQEDEIPY